MPDNVAEEQECSAGFSAAAAELVAWATHAVHRHGLDEGEVGELLDLAAGIMLGEPIPFTITTEA